MQNLEQSAKNMEAVLKMYDRMMCVFRVTAVSL